jgi:hypothetical protein
MNLVKKKCFIKIYTQKNKTYLYPNPNSILILCNIVSPKILSTNYFMNENGNNIVVNLTALSFAQIIMTFLDL